MFWQKNIKQPHYIYFGVVYIEVETLQNILTINSFLAEKKKHIFITCIVRTKHNDKVIGFPATIIMKEQCRMEQTKIPNLVLISKGGNLDLPLTQSVWVGAL